MKYVFLSSFAHLVLERSVERVSGGAELQVALLARELAVRGREVVIIGSDVGKLDGQVIDGVLIRSGGNFHTGKLGDTIRAIPKVWRIVWDEQPDVVGVLGWTTWLYLMIWFRRWMRLRVLFICGLDTEVNGEFRRQHPVRGFFFERGMRLADIRMAMTTHQADLFVRRGMTCGLYRNLILVRTTPRLSEKSIGLLWVARCQRIKRPQLFLDLAERLPDVNCEMICVREDVELWESVQSRAAKLPNVKFRERVPYHEVQGYYDRAKIFVNTSTFEGWANSFIQAGLGSAALASLSVNSDQLFERYALGVFGNGKFEPWLQEIRTLLGDPTRLAECQRECERFVEEFHNNARNVDLFIGAVEVG